MRGKLPEPEVCVLTRHGGKIHGEEIRDEFAVNVVELEAFRVLLILLPVRPGERIEGMSVERAVIARAFVNDKTLSLLHLCQGVRAVRALKEQIGDKGLSRHKPVAAYLAQELAVATGIVIEIFVWSPAVRAFRRRINGTITSAPDGFESFAKQTEMLFNKNLVVKLFKLANEGWFIHGKALVLGAFEVVIRLGRGKLVNNR